MPTYAEFQAYSQDGRDIQRSVPEALQINEGFGPEAAER